MPYNVLFLCTGNSARSIIAEAILNREGSGRFRAFSAGTHPKGRCIPTRSTCSKRLELRHRRSPRSKSWDEFAAPGRAADGFRLHRLRRRRQRDLPGLAGPADDRALGRARPGGVRRHRGREAPAFADAYRMLDNRISIFISLPIASLDRLSLQQRLDEIGERRRQGPASRPDAIRPAAPPRRRGARHRACCVATVVGSGIMAERLTDDVALALLGNTLPTGAILVVLITMLGPVSGAHFNPAVTLVFALRREICAPRGGAPTSRRRSPAASPGACSPTPCSSCRSCSSRTTVRTGPGQWLAEAVATFGLVVTILAGLRFAARGRALAGRALHHRRLLVHRLDVVRQPGRHHRARLSDTFAGIRPVDVPAFILALSIPDQNGAIARRDTGP